MTNQTKQVLTLPENETFLSQVSTLENDTLFSKYPPALLDFAAACCIVFAVVGVIGNSVSCLALVSCPRLRNATTAFIVNLCVSDFIICVFSLPLCAITFLEREWSYGNTLCKLFPLFRYSNGTVSLFSVIAIAVNRYVLIVYPRWYSSIYQPRYIGIMIASFWLISLWLLSLPLLEVWGRFGYDPKVGTCTILRKNGKSPKMFFYIAAFVLPSVIFVFCYSRVYCVVRKTSKKVHKDSKRSVVQDFHGNSFKTHGWLNKTHPMNASCSSMVTHASPKREKKELRVLRVMLVIFLTFLICYFPVSFVKILKKEDDLPFLNIFGYLAVYFSNCINPVIYIAISQEYRQAYLRLFTCHESPNTEIKMSTQTSSI